MFVWENAASDRISGEVSLSRIDARIGPITVAYEDIIVGALMLIGLGLSFMVMPSRKLRREGEGGQ